MDRERLRHEALRVNQRYAIEAVEVLGLCPWAYAARRGGRVLRTVVFGREPDLDTTLAEIAAIAAEPGAEVGLVIFPELVMDRYEFQRFTSDVRERDSARYPPGEAPLAMAPFHPHAKPDMETPARLVSFARRTPDPTIQVVRRSVLAQVRKSEGTSTGTVFASAEAMTPIDWNAPREPPPLHERIAEANHATIARLGVAHVEQLFDDIRADRDRAYAAIESDEEHGQDPADAEVAGR